MPSERNVPESPSEPVERYRQGIIGVPDRIRGKPEHIRANRRETTSDLEKTEEERNKKRRRPRASGRNVLNTSGMRGMNAREEMRMEERVWRSGKGIEMGRS